MDEEQFAKALLSHERKEWQNPERIISQINVKPGDTVADLGCGPGFFIVALSKIVGASGMVYAVDRSPVMLRHLVSHLERAKINSDNVKIIEKDVSKTGIPSETCDIVLFANVLHDIDDSQEFLKEVKRISKPEKALVVDIDWKDTDTGIGPPLEIRFSERKAKMIISSSGFKFERKIDTGPYHYGLVFSA